MIGTPYHHQGRLPGVGLDCVGLVMAVARRVGKPLTDDVYGHWPQPGRVLRWLAEENAATLAPVDAPEPGDIRTFWWTKRDTLWHVGVVTENGLIHVHRSAGVVLEMALDRRWLKRSGPVFRFRE